MSQDITGLRRRPGVDGRILGADRTKEKQERGAHLARFLAGSPDGLGGVNIRGYSSLEEFELIKAALMPLSAPVTSEPGACGGTSTPAGERLIDENGHQTNTACADPTCGHTGRDPRDHGKRFWDALVEACHRLIGRDQIPHDHGTSARIIVTIDHAHHVVHWADGVVTSLDNLVLLCRHHHTVTHNTPWTVAIDPDTGRPVWKPPPKIDVRDRITYVPARRAA